MDDREPTAWEDINPGTALARQREQHSQSLARLTPATSDEFRNELTACLALVVPVGMTEEGRREWLAVAWETLKHLPADVLAIGCAKARKACDHPSKIVPTIIEETEGWMRSRREAAREAGRPPKAIASPDICTPEQAQAILAEFGLRSKFPSSRNHS